MSDKEDLLTVANLLIDRLEKLLPGEMIDIDPDKYTAFRWQYRGFTS